MADPICRWRNVTTSTLRTFLIYDAPIKIEEDGKVFAINTELYEAMIQACKVLKKARGEAE